MAALLALLLCWIPAAAEADAAISAQVTPNTFGQALPSGFVGMSAEYQALQAYTGRDPAVVDPVLVRLLRALAPGQAPVLRVGGDSTDHTWLPVRHVKATPGVYYKLTKNWLATTRSLTNVLHAQLILGVNLAANRPAFAAAEARAFLSRIGRRHISAFEIGNEPDLYALFVYYHDRKGRHHHARPRNYDLGAFIKEFSRWRAALPTGPVAGPAFAGLDWMKGLSQFLNAEPHLALVTFHRYALRACETDPTKPDYPTIPALLSDASSSGLAQQVAPYVVQTHGHGIPFRLDELNSAACRGKRGVSDTFASALWALDALFNLASVGVDGVNIHTLPHAAYELFTVSHTGRGWHAFVHPEYYGLMAFAQMFPPGARLLSVNAPAGQVKVWATQGLDGHVRVAVINKDPNNGAQVQLQLPGAQTSAIARVLIAPTIGSSSGVVLGGQSFGPDTTTGQLSGSPQSTTVNSAGGNYTVSVPGGSAVLLTK